MKRSTARQIAVNLCYYSAASGKPVQEIAEEFFDKDYYSTLIEADETYTEYPDKKEQAYIMRLASLVGEHSDELDGMIEKYSHGWKIQRISKTALAVLRCALCEIIYMDDIPNGAAINEAVELSKSYDDEETVSFVNGVLGGYMRGEFADTENV